MEAKTTFRATMRYCPKCHGIMFLQRDLNIWECRDCGRRQGAWLRPKEGRRTMA